MVNISSPLNWLFRSDPNGIPFPISTPAERSVGVFSYTPFLISERGIPPVVYLEIYPQGVVYALLIFFLGYQTPFLISREGYQKPIRKYLTEELRSGIMGVWK